MASRSKRRRGAAIEPEMAEEEELTDVDEDASALLPTYTAGEPPPSRGDGSICLQDYCEACSELANLLAAAAVGRAGDAAWLYCVLGVSELRAAVRPRLAAWTRTLESALCPKGARHEAHRSEEARDMYEALTVLYNLPHPGRARYTSDAARTSAKAKYEAAQKKVAPIMQALCDGEPRALDPRWQRLQKMPKAQVLRLLEQLEGDRERLLLADDTLQHHLYKHLCSPVMEPAKATALLASCVPAAWRSGGGPRPFHDVDEAHLVQHLGWSFGPHGESILALMRKVCEVCMGLGHGTACNTWGGRGAGRGTATSTASRSCSTARALSATCRACACCTLGRRASTRSSSRCRGVAAPPSTAAPRKRSSKRCTERGAGYPTRRDTCRPPSSSRWCARARWARTWCTTGASCSR